MSTNEANYIMEVLIGLVIIGELVIGWLLLAGKEYSKQKGKNIATKEDVSEITSLIEGAKSTFSQDLEKLKQELSIEIEYAKFIAELRFQAFNKLAKLKEDINRSTRREVTGEEVNLAKSLVELETYVKARLSILSSFEQEIKDFNASVNRMLEKSREHKANQSPESEKQYRKSLEDVMCSLDEFQKAVIDIK